VKFRHREVTRHTVEAALLYVLTRIQGRPLGESSVYGLGCKSVAAPASDVVYVDEIDVAARHPSACAGTSRLVRHLTPRTHRASDSRSGRWRDRTTAVGL
jgi:hypothetical protein